MSLLLLRISYFSIIVEKKLMPDNKGPGYHWSMMLIGMFGAVTGVLGLPFLTAATVRCVRIDVCTSTSHRQRQCLNEYIQAYNLGVCMCVYC